MNERAITARYSRGSAPVIAAVPGLRSFRTLPFADGACIMLIAG